MNANILKIGGASLIDCIARDLHLEESYLKLIGESENFVYEYQGNLILRVSPVSHRDIEEISAELDWIEYLNKNGVPAARAVAMKDSTKIAVFESHGVKFYAVFFEIAKGRKPLNTEGVARGVESDDNFYKLWGRTLGKMHKIAKSYIPSNPRHVRKQWNEVIPKMHRQQEREIYSTILEKQEKMIEYLSGLPKDSDSFGMIHSDFTYDNFFVHDSEIYPFDFDHCKYHWFVYDIAILLDAARYLYKKGIDEKTHIKHFFECFMDGYAAENTLGEFWIKQIPEFTKLWKVDSFIPVVNKADLESLEVWEKRLLTKMRRDIEKEIPYFTLEG